ncbi:MAG: Ig-like domain-containing protein, partial [Candidatus Zixiibacteriota bacterium]
MLSCAEVAPPPGGEVDRTSPYLIGSQPEDGAINVILDNRIVLRFSEQVVEPRAGRAVYISPRPVREPKLRWKGDRLEIVLPDSFQTDETYVVSLSTDIADLRNNKLDSTGAIAFSTGPSIDSGYVSGTVFSQMRPAAGVLVGLYSQLPFGDTPTGVDSVFPEYVTQTNQQGQFLLQYLPQREYHLIAFQDQNWNERLDPFREMFALP